MFDLNERVAVVTGAAQGLGSAIARQLARAGARVVVNYRKRHALAQTLVEQLEKQGARAVAVEADVTCRDEVERLSETTVSAFGRIDIWVNNAGSYPLDGLLEMSDESWHAVIESNLLGVHLGTQTAGRKMRDQTGGGAIVNIASIEGHTPGNAHAHYAAAKAAVLMHTRSAA